MIRGSTRPRTRRRGGVAVVVALGMVPLIGVLAFAIDGGLLLAAKRRAQTVADAAAHAAACQLYKNILSDLTGLDVTGKARAAALLNAADNGFNNGSSSDGSSNTITINIPPKITSNTFLNNQAGYVEVIVTYNQPRYFSGVVWSGSLQIGAYAIARGTSPQPKPFTTASIITLDPSASGALSATGGAMVNAESTIQVNSSNSTAAKWSNAAITSAPSVQIVGSYSKDISSLFPKGLPQTAAPVIPDPLASLAAPSLATLTTQGTTNVSGITTINPGIYNGGLTVNWGTTTLNPGVYYMKGGGVSVKGGAILKGTGVTIYVDNGGGSLEIQGGATVILTPPTSGATAGLTYFQDRTSTKALNIANGTIVTMSGTIYAAKAGLSLAGGNYSKYGSQLVVSTLALSNGINLNMPTTTDAKLGYVASGAATGSGGVSLVN